MKNKKSQKPTTEETPAERIARLLEINTEQESTTPPKIQYHPSVVMAARHAINIAKEVVARSKSV